MIIEKAIDSLEVFPARNRIFDPIEFPGLYRHLIKNMQFIIILTKIRKKL